MGLLINLHMLEYEEKIKEISGIIFLCCFYCMSCKNVDFTHKYSFADIHAHKYTYFHELWYHRQTHAVADGYKQ